MDITEDRLKTLLDDSSVDRLDLTEEQRAEYHEYKNGIGETLKKVERLQEKLDKLFKSKE